MAIEASVTTPELPTASVCTSTDTIVINASETTRKITTNALTKSDIMSNDITQTEVNNLFT